MQNQLNEGVLSQHETKELINTDVCLLVDWELLREGEQSF